MVIIEPKNNKSISNGENKPTANLLKKNFQASENINDESKKY